MSGARQLSLHVPVGGHILEHRRGSDDPPALVSDCRARENHVDPPAVLGDPLGLKASHRAESPHFFSELLQFLGFAQLRRQQNADRLADHFRGTVPEDRFRTPIPGGHDVFGIQCHDRIGGVLEDVGHETVLCVQLVFQPADCREVPSHSNRAQNRPRSVFYAGGRKRDRSPPSGRRKEFGQVVAKPARFLELPHDPSGLLDTARIEFAYLAAVGFARQQAQHVASRGTAENDAPSGIGGDHRVQRNLFQLASQFADRSEAACDVLINPVPSSRNRPFAMRHNLTPSAAVPLVLRAAFLFYQLSSVSRDRRSGPGTESLIPDHNYRLFCGRFG
jgi:hypothetical protein